MVDLTIGALALASDKPPLTLEWLKDTAKTLARNTHSTRGKGVCGLYITEARHLSGCYLEAPEDPDDGQGGVSGFTVEVIKRITGEPGFKVLPRRGVVERTFGWMVRLAPPRARLRAAHRRLEKHDLGRNGQSAALPLMVVIAVATRPTA